MKKLEDRILQYMRKFGDGVWVQKQKIIDVAHLKGFSQGQIATAFRKIDEFPDVGKAYRAGETFYCWYEITEEQRADYWKKAKWFDSL